MSIFIDTSCKKEKSDQLCRKVKGDKNVHTRFTNVMTVEQHEKIVYTKIIQPVELKKKFFYCRNKTDDSRIPDNSNQTNFDKGNKNSKTIKKFKNSQCGYTHNCIMPIFLCNI